MISKTTIFATFFIFSAFLEALPTGAPLNTCQSMLPRHNAEPIDTDNPPYEIVFSSVNNSTLKVILQSKEEDKSFRGFLMQARREWNGEAIGKWSTSEESTKTIDCFDREDSAVTHDHKQNPISRKVGFKKLAFEWTCPEGMSPNGVILIATIAETSKVIYVNVSKVVHVETPKFESISFDDFGETTEESIRDPFDFEKAVHKKQEENFVREPEMDIERERPVEINEMKNFQNEAVDQQMGRLNRIQEVESRPISVDRLKEKISHRIMDNQNMLGLEEPIRTVDERPKSIMNAKESIKSQRINKLNSMENRINGENLISQEPAEPKETLVLDESMKLNKINKDSMTEKKEESKTKNIIDDKRKLVKAHELFSNNDSEENFNGDSQIGDEKKMEIKRLQAQIRVLKLKLKKILENN